MADTAEIVREIEEGNTYPSLPCFPVVPLKMRRQPVERECNALIFKACAVVID